MTYEEKIEKAKNVLKLAAEMSREYYDAPLVITYSGGKDSDVMLDIASKCLKPDQYEALYSSTSVDAPETTKHIRKTFARYEQMGVKCTIRYPRDKDGKVITMWNLIPRKSTPPTRLIRYCCSVLKEASTPNRLVATGVRADESIGRRGRDVFSVRGKTKKQALFFSLEHSEEVFKETQEIQDPLYDCTLISNMRSQNDVICNPIYDLTDTDVWRYIRENGLEVNSLYSNGYKRVGCIGCPLSGRKSQMKEFDDYPHIKNAYIHAFDKMVAVRKEHGLPTKWKDGKDVFKWWTFDPTYPGQLSFDEDGNIHEDE